MLLWRLIRRIGTGIVCFGLSMACQGQASFSIDHSLFDRILRETVTDGLVDYAKLAQPQYYTDLQTYISQLAEAPFHSMTREEQIATAINAYNANCLNGVLKERKIKTVKEVWFFFKNTKFHLGGKEMSLDSLEQDVLRKMNEPRIHFTIVRATRGGPSLASHAYRGETIESELEEAARLFLRNQTQNRLDREKKTLYLSPILKWFKKDFTTQAPSIKAYVLPFLSDADQSFLKEQPVKIKFLEFDWGLNGHF